MRRIGLCSLIAVALLSSFTLSAQTSVSGHQTTKADMNFTDAVNYQLAHPTPLVRTEPIAEDEDEDEQPRHKPGDPSQVHMIRRAAERTVSGTGGSSPAYLPVSPAPNDTFLATITTGTNIPSDTHGAVDSTYCVTALNSGVYIQNRSGGLVKSLVGLDKFWAPVLPATTGSFDPRVHFDPFRNRWILISDAVTSGTMVNSTLLVAVSATADPTGTWHEYAIPLDATGKAWMDFPDVGFNKRWIAVTGNFYANSTGGEKGAAVYVFVYDSVAAGVSAPFQKITQTKDFTICPALTYDTTEPNLFAVEAWNAGAGQLKLWKISGSLTAPTMTSIGYPTTTTAWQGSEPGGTDFAPQAGSTNKFDLGDNRITSCTYRNHYIWCAHNAFLPATGTATRCSAMWWQIDSLANPLQNGLVDNATGPQFYGYPSIAVNQNNDALIGFSAFSSITYASCGYALHLHTDPADSTRPPHIYRHGQQPYYQIFGGTKNRWGDYSATCLDPKNNTDFWTVQESVSSVGSNLWDTWWAYVVVCPANASFTLAHDSIDATSKDTITFTGTAPAGTSITWSASGGTILPDTGTVPQSVKWTSSGWKVITVTVTVSGCTTTYTDSVYVRKNVGVAQVKDAAVDAEIVPNPNDGSFQIVFPAASDKATSVTIADMQGRVVYAHEFGITTDNKLPVKADNLPPGNYIVTIRNDQSEISKKISVNR